MPEFRDSRIREAISDLALASRPAPHFDEIGRDQMAPPMRRTPDWVVAMGVAVVLLIVIGTLTMVSGRLGDPRDPAPPIGVVTTETDDGPLRDSTAAGVWINPRGGTLLSVSPAVLAPVEGIFEVSVRGFAPGESGGTWVMACPGARGVVDPGSWPGWNGDLTAACQLRDDAIASVTAPWVEGSFEATLQVQVNDTAIQDGGVVIVAGHMWVPASGTVLLRIADESETPWETATRSDVVNVSRLMNVISYWPPFITTFNATYDQMLDCDQAYSTAQAGQSGYLDALELWDDTIRETPGIEYDRHVARLMAAERWLQDHSCPGSHDFVQMG